MQKFSSAEKIAPALLAYWRESLTNWKFRAEHAAEIARHEAAKHDRLPDRKAECG